MNISGLSFELFILIWSPGTDFSKLLTEDFFTILGISVFGKFWHYVGHLRVKLFPFPISRHEAFALIKFSFFGYCLGMPAEVNTNNLKVSRWPKS